MGKPPLDAVRTRSCWKTTNLLNWSPKLPFKNAGVGAGEITQMVRCLLCKQANPSSNPQYPHKGDMVLQDYNPGAGAARVGGK